MDQNEPLPPIPTSLTLEVSRTLGIALVAVSVAKKQSMETVALTILDAWAKQQISDSEMLKRMMRGTPWEIG